jgi:hypothetical protein
MKILGVEGRVDFADFVAFVTFVCMAVSGCACYG